LRRKLAKQRGERRKGRSKWVARTMGLIWGRLLCYEGPRVSGEAPSAILGPNILKLLFRKYMNNAEMISINISWYCASVVGSGDSGSALQSLGVRLLEATISGP
jgi:hypothetical protein